MDYTPDYDGIGDYLKTSPELHAELERRAQLGLELGRALAPVYNRPGRHRIPGTLAASGEVTDDGIGGIHDDRMQLSIEFNPMGENSDFYGAAGTYQHQPGGTRDKNRGYLLAMIPIIEA